MTVAEGPLGPEVAALVCWCVTLISQSTADYSLDTKHDTHHHHSLSLSRLSMALALDNLNSYMIFVTESVTVANHDARKHS